MLLLHTVTVFGVLFCVTNVRWHCGWSGGLAIERSRVWLLLGHCWHNNLTQVVHTLVPLRLWKRC